MRGYGDNGPEVRTLKGRNIFQEDPCWDVREDIDAETENKQLGVESKAFELEMVEKGGTTLTIMESKKGVSSWVRMGLNSVGLLMEGLQQCIEDRRDGIWEKRWKEKGPKLLHVKGAGRRWVEALCQLGIIADRKVQQEGTRISGRPSPEKVKGRSFADTVKAWGEKEPSPIRGGGGTEGD
ncbi:hypothetical protein CK203_053054 [Vitis vinifera]|uniref:Uncharacterized protein n=1 Tax=Vitis vinifera TaxID=29760 RepID=A0A438FKZ1_VITVI|nr:hypothetical protein CK203_053054 [Vitis vinifera]